MKLESFYQIDWCTYRKAIKVNQILLRLLKSRHYQIRLVLWLTGVAVSITIAQWLHELGHIVVAWVAGAPIKEIRFWPPWDQHVVAEFDSIFWQRMGFWGGFLITFIPFLYLFIFFVLKKSKWAYVLVFPFFQTFPSSQGDFEALGFFIPFVIYFSFAWILPAVAFVLLALVVEERQPTSKRNLQR